MLRVEELWASNYFLQYPSLCQMCLMMMLENGMEHLSSSWSKPKRNPLDKMSIP